MKAECFKTIESETPEKEYECDSYEAVVLTPHHHEVIITKDGKHKLLEVTGEARQGTSPERYAAVRMIRDDGSIAGVYAIDGRATGGDPLQSMDPEVTLPDDKQPDEVEELIESLNYKDTGAWLEARKIEPAKSFKDRQQQVRDALTVKS